MLRTWCLELGSWCAVLTTLLFVVAIGTPAGARADGADVAFDLQPDCVVITVGGKPLATYVFHDSQISRPYFAHVHAPSGQQVSRNHPPRDGDAQDHATFHPGIWMAFGDISGSDYWRLKAKVEHAAFVEPPHVRHGVGSFTVRNRYLSADGSSVVCEEMCRYDLHVRPAGYLLAWDSRFSSERDFYFGDQEEMGLGMRVATPLAVVNGGRILDSAGRVNGKEVWGKQAQWCDYSGEIAGLPLGMTLMPHPKNFRPCWFHARDYGFVAANPFGVKAFTGGKASRVEVAAKEELRLRFGVWLHSGPTEAAELDATFKDYVQRSDD